LSVERSESDVERSAPKGAVFLSYARDDAAAARRIAEALRASGLEVWFDENELRGGDAWDAKIRQQIDACVLFVAVISKHTQERSKGYFRLEWKLAVDQTHLLAAGVPFVAPVVIDDTPEGGAMVPPEFLKVQWMRLPGALPTPQFVEQVKRLMGGKSMEAGRPRPAIEIRGEVAVPPKKAVPLAVLGISLGVVAVSVGVVFFATGRPGSTEGAAPPGAPAALVAAPDAKPQTPDPVRPPQAADKSVAVLAFADLSADKGGEYFSDGISEELLNVLAKVPGLRVAARTSAFFFKGKNLPIPEIAAKLNVAYIVEGSVQRAGDRVKITAQLIKAADGFHVWSDTFTREAKDVFAVQEEIAGRIAKELSLKLGVSSAAATAAVNPEAFELFLQARQAWNQRNTEAYARAEALVNRAIALQPDFARAHALLAMVWVLQAVDGDQLGLFNQRDTPVVHRIRAQIDRALALDPNLAEARTALGNLYWQTWQTEPAVRELRLAISLNPNYATAHQWLGRRLLTEGRLEEGEAMMRRATELDPLSHRILDNYSIPLMVQGRYQEALMVLDRALALQPDSIQAGIWKTLTLGRLGRHAEAVALLRKLPWAGSSYEEYAAEAFTRAGLPAEAEQAWASIPAGASAATKAGALARMGRPQEALAAMDPATMSISNANELLFDEIYDPIRADPRFVKLLAALGLTEAHARAQAWRVAQPQPPMPAKK
jgi:TolB-like protein/Flp pilus assembly protein TadD